MTTPQSFNPAFDTARSAPAAAPKTGLATRILGACCALAVTLNLLALIAGYALPAADAAPQQLASAASASAVAARTQLR